MQINRLLLACFLSTAAASTGDWLPPFRDCVSECTSNQCPRDMGLLKLLLWTCEEDCDYRCQQELTNDQELTGQRIHQYHGKWPFKRYFGIQELASVVFSVLNFLPNYSGYKMLSRPMHGSANTMRKIYRGAALFGMNAWLWSSVFHVRDFVATERLDYFSATLAVAYGMIIAASRLFKLYKPDRQVYLVLISVIMTCLAAAHIYYLAFVHFDYGYNMMASVGVGAVQNVLWLTFSALQYRKTRNFDSLVPAILVVAVTFGMSFELLDFAPFARAIDAHSLWHLATVLPYYFWFAWMQRDLNALEERQKEKNN